jgi:hypothetical protein
MMTDRPLTDLDRLILQYVARGSLEDTDNRDGWCRWGEPERAPWDFQDYKPLVVAGLLERRETWKDILLRLTAAGWLALHSAPDVALPEPRRNVVGTPFEGDVLP